MRPDEHRKDDSHLLRAGLALSLLGIATGGLGYIFQLAMGEILSAEAFTTFNAILAISVVICSPVGAVQTVAARHVSLMNAMDGLGAAQVMFRCWTSRIWMLCGIVTAGLWWAGPPACDLFGLPDLLSFWLLVVIVLATTLSTVNNAFFQGLEAFGWYGSLPFVGALTRLGLATTATSWCGWGLHGALGGVATAGLVVLVAGIWGMNRRLSKACPAIASRLRFPCAMVPSVMAAATALAVMTQIDLVLVNRYFDPASAAQYALAAVLGKAVLYLPGGLATAIVPIVTARHAREEKGGTPLAHALLATVCLCGGAAVFYGVAGPWLVNLLYGEKYGDAGSLLAVYGLAMVPMAVAIVMHGFLIARGRTLFCWMAVALAAWEFFVMSEWHPSLHAVIGTVAAFNTALAIVGGILIVPAFQNSPGSPAED